jgi:pimeloyl-ACP methyl ester carboxylesterase
MDDVRHPGDSAGPSGPVPKRHLARLNTVLRVAGAGTLGLAGAGLAELRFRRRLAADPEYQRLLDPLHGEAVAAASKDGTSIHAEVFGPEHGAATFVLAPGWTETLALFDSMTRELVELGFRVVAYDLRGQGHSATSASGDWHVDRYGEDLEAVLEATCAGRHDVVVAGHSMGAMSIAAWARHHEVPARVRGVMLMNTGLAGLIAATKLLPQVLPLALAVPLARWTFMANPMPMPGLSTLLSRAVLRYVAFGPYASDAQIVFYERMLMSCPPRVRAAAGLAMCDMDLLDAIENITVPALVLSGRLDRLTPTAHAEQIAESLPHLVRIIELAGIGHMGPLESPHDLVMALLEVHAAAQASSSQRPVPTV